MDLLTTAAVVGCFNAFFKVVIGPGLEKRLGRKLTDWDWQVYWKEVEKKEGFEADQKMRRERHTRLNDQGIIHDFVWNEKKARLIN